MPDFEALGDMATGGVIARAVEPRAGEDGHTHEGRCLNCGTELAGPFCHACGQHAHVHRTIGAWWHDFLHSVLHLDGKFVLTMPMLAWRPGELTRRYAHGERAKFISPLALFLFSVFLMVAVFAMTGANQDFDLNQTTAEARAEAIADYQKERDATLKELRAARAAGDRMEVRQLESALKLQDRLFRQSMVLISADARRDEQMKAREAQADAAGAKQQQVEEDERVVLIAGADSLNEWARKAYEKAKKNPELLIYKLQANAYKFSWALIPISVPFVWILFLHRRRYREEITLYDHLVFVTYSIAFMSLAFIAYALLDMIGVPEALLALAFLLIPPLHMYRQLKGAYGLTRFGAAWRTAALLVFASIALSLFAILLLVLAA